MSKKPRPWMMGLWPTLKDQFREVNPENDLIRSPSIIPAYKDQFREAAPGADNGIPSPTGVPFAEATPVSDSVVQREQNAAAATPMNHAIVQRDDAMALEQERLRLKQKCHQLVALVLVILGVSLIVAIAVPVALAISSRSSPFQDLQGTSQIPVSRGASTLPTFSPQNMLPMSISPTLDSTGAPNISASETPSLTGSPVIGSAESPGVSPNGDPPTWLPSVMPLGAAPSTSSSYEEERSGPQSVTARTGAPAITSRSFPPNPAPIMLPTRQPTRRPVVQPTNPPSASPTRQPVMNPTRRPVVQPTNPPTASPTRRPVVQPTHPPTVSPTRQPVATPTQRPVVPPTLPPTVSPTRQPIMDPTPRPVPPTPGPVMRASTILSYINSVSLSSASHSYPSQATPQEQALKWLIDEDVTTDASDLLSLRQRFALATMWFANGPFDSAHTETWLSSMDVCDWQSVADCVNGEVTSLWLGSDGLSGAIPADLGLLTALTNLQLWINQLTGTIPIEIGELTALTTFEMRENQLTGSIPSEIGELSALMRLDLESNQLSGSIPSQILALSFLNEFWVNDNSLTGRMPFCDGDSSRFIRLYAECEEVNCSCCTRCCADGVGFGQCIAN